MPPRSGLSALVFGPLVAALVSACGGAPREVKAPPVPPPPEAPRAAEPVPVAQQELGSIEEKDIERTFGVMAPELDTCATEGRARVRSMSGDAKLFLRIDAAGKLKYGYFEESTLGDRETEKCILASATRAQWPAPKGGEAEVRHTFGWSGGDRTPGSWTADKVLDALHKSKKVRAETAKCKVGVRGVFQMTAYVRANGKRGKFATVGGAPPGREGESKIDCLVRALRPLDLPNPGRKPAKVSFTM